MPINLARRLAGRKRSADANRHLGLVLTFVAGATNAGGFMAVQQHTSHMTGIVASMADNIALGGYGLVLSGIGGLLCFLLGAACTALMVNYSRRQKMYGEFALPLLLEAALLLCFGLLGAKLSSISGLFVPVTVMLLCFIMGLQNALITKLSNAEIRTTHVTGIVTDIGIELGKLVYWNADKSPSLPKVSANRSRLKVLSLLLMSFFLGGIIGALGFQHIGYIVTVPLALALVLLAIVPAVDDLLFLRRRFLRRRRR